MTHPRIIIATAEYHIVQAGPRDYDAFITGRGYIGSRATKAEAERLIREYRSAA